MLGHMVCSKIWFLASKALIVGPDNTPYENGCFLFDILLGGMFNTTPPLVKSMTNKSGKFRLNPNLYVPCSIV